MSGIFGFSIKNSNNAKKILNALNYWNAHYGIEASDTLLDEGYGIGCHIEHFSDAFSFGKPILKNNNTIAVIDAVIYNREELTDDLTISDEELLFSIINDKGYSALKQVNGDFAGAVYDKNAKVWTLFRDHMGVRPLFYYEDDNIFAFSTDMRGLLALPGARIHINEKKLYLRMMGYNDLTPCGTDYDNIYCIQPAAWTVIKASHGGYMHEEHIFWKLKQTKIHLKNDKAYKNELRRLITDSVKRRLDAVPGIIGGELSGGLDSGVIDILITRLGGEGRYYSWSYPLEMIPLQDGDDERKIILDICKQENITCKFASTKRERVISDLLDEVTPPYVNTPNLSDGSAYLKSQGAKVVFTGHGGDEGVSHRCNTYELWYNREYFSFFRAFWDTTKGKKLRLFRTIRRVMRQIFKDNKRYAAPFWNAEINTNAFLKNSFKERMSKTVKPETLYFAYAPEKYVEQGGTRIRLDNVAYHGAKNGVRYMIPFVDHRVIDFAVSIPRRLYLKNGINRYIYREAFRDILPDSLYNMRYKDTASQRNYNPEKDIRNDFVASINDIVSRLDREFWKEYLDFNAIENFTLPENYTKDDYFKTAFMLHDLTMCVILQNAREHSGKRCNKHE